MTRGKAKGNKANLMEKSINHSLLPDEEQNSSPLAEIVDKGEADLPQAIANSKEALRR